MPFVTRPITPRTRPGAQVAEAQKELSALGFRIPAEELRAKRFGTSTVAAVKGFQKRYGLRENGTVDVSTGRLMHVGSLFASSDDHAVLRTAIRKGVAAAKRTNPQELYWLARYAIINGDYETAKVAASKAGAYAPVRADIEPVIGWPTPGRGQPEVPYPENFYSYRRPLVDPSWVERVHLDLVQHPELPRQEWAMQAIAAHRHWNAGNDHAVRRRYDAAVAEYDACQDAVLSYFDLVLKSDVDFLPVDDRSKRLTKLITYIYQPLSNQHTMLEYFQTRRELLSLVELDVYDARALKDAYSSGTTFIEMYLSSDLSPAHPIDFRLQSLDPPLVTLAYVLVPLARAEANRMRRQYQAAILDLQWVLNFSVIIQQSSTGIPIFTLRNPLTCAFIEMPFARLLLAETLLDKADAEYKARIPADPSPAPSVSDYQDLKAAQTYIEVQDLFKDEGEYLARVQSGRDQLESAIRARLDAEDTQSQAFQTLGMDSTVPTISGASNTLPGLDPHTGPHESLLRFTTPGTDGTMRETNPRVYAILLTAIAKLEQLHAQFNWLGYRDDYIPPWRFPFLLERARYFAEHAKNAQREYLNFLSNAEREEFQELTTAQNVEMEKSNIRIETARVDQVRLEVAAALESFKLARLASTNAQLRLFRYQAFDDEMDDLESDALLASIGFGLLAVAAAALVVATAPVSAPIVIGGAAIAAGAGAQAVNSAQNVYNTNNANSKADAQREMEKYNLELSVQEALQADRVAQEQLGVAAAGMVVAGLQRQAALLRHEFAIQNLTFLRNRALSAEQWYRLVAGIRSVSETYLRYAVELAFLSEQAYEFEVDKRINVIRFDYDISELGDMLAADFLLRDLDTLEQDLIVSQRLRQQQVRYVLSLGREFPEATQELRENGVMTFSLRLEQLERRFPGLFNLRISSVEVLPVALMDSTRFSLQMTHQGAGQVRLKAQPDTVPGTPSPSTLNTNDLDIEGDDWLRGLREQWPVKVRVTGPETAVFSGLSRQDQAGLSTFFTANQRGAFEGLAGASAWAVDMSMKENRIVPGTLADVLITFTLSGYYDDSLRRAIDAAPRKAMSTTTWFSAHRSFPDAFFQFNRSGRMNWDITSDFLSLNGSPDSVRNVGVLLQPSPTRPALGRLLCSYPVEFEVNANGRVEILTALPRVTLTTQGLILQAQTDFPSDTTATWDFGDGAGISDRLSHTYAKPGRYDVLLRLASNSRLFEYRLAVVVSRDYRDLPAPLIAVPELRVTRSGGRLKLRPSLDRPTDESVSMTWRLDNKPPDEGTGPVTFTLEPGRHVLHFAAVRSLKGRFYCKQRYVPDETFALTGLHLSTNRTFEVGTNVERTTSRNPFTRHLFGTSGESRVLSPIDRWTFELPLEDNPSVTTVSATDVLQYDLSEISDALLALEYKARET